MRKFLILGLLLAVLGISVSAQTPPGGYTSPSSSSSSGSGITQANANPPLAFNFSPGCTSLSPVTGCVNTTADLQMAVDCAWNSGSPTVTCNSAHFVPADTGKFAFGYQTCNAFTGLLATNAASGATVNSGGSATTMTYVSATSVTLSANAANSAGVQTGSTGGGCFWWGHDDGAGAATLSTQVAAQVQCPKVFFTNAYYLISNMANWGFMINQPTGCLINGAVYGSTFGNLFYSYGVDLEGRGVAVTQLVLAPWLTGCTNGPEANSCFVQPIESQWENFSFTGGQNSQGISNTTLLREIGPNTLNFVSFLNWGAGNSTTRCSTNTAQATWYQVNNSGCGAVGHHVGNDITGASWSGKRVSIENSPSAAIEIGATDSFPPDYSVYCDDCRLYNAEFAGGNNNIIRTAGGSVSLLRTDLSIGNNLTAMSGIQATASGARIILKQTDFRNTNLNTGSGSVFCSAACMLVMEDSTLAFGSTGRAYFDAAGSKFIDQGNDVGLAGGAGTGIAGTYIADGHSVIGACTGTTLAAGGTFGLYGTGPNITSTTCGGLTAGTIGNGIPLSAPRTLALLVVTASNAGSGVGSGVVTVMKNGAATAITCTIGTGTSCTDGTHTVAAVSGDLISIQFTAAASDTLAGIKAIAGWN
jgi:hypothetical protein